MVDVVVAFATEIFLIWSKSSCNLLKAKTSYPSAASSFNFYHSVRRTSSQLHPTSSESTTGFDTIAFTTISITTITIANTIVTIITTLTVAISYFAVFTVTISHVAFITIIFALINIAFCGNEIHEVNSIFLRHRISVVCKNNMTVNCTSHFRGHKVIFCRQIQKRSVNFGKCGCFYLEAVK